MNKRIYLILTIFVFCIAFFLRFYKLGEVPFGLYQDETAIGYNAFSILQTGKDEYGNVYPLYFKSFGDYKLPLYIYLTALSVKMFGLTEFAVRFPSALFGFLTVVLFYCFVKQLTKNNIYALTASFFLAINPWHLHYTRATFEVSISLFLFLLGYICMFSFFTHKKRFTFLASVLCFIMSLYAYNLTRLLSPLLFLLGFFTFKKILDSWQKKEILLSCIITLILLIPFLQTFFTKGGVNSAQGTLIFTSAAVQAPLHELRMYFNLLPGESEKLLFNSYTLTSWQYIQNIFAYFSIPFFFLYGSPHGNHGIGNVGYFYIEELVFIIMGVYVSIKNKAFWSPFMLAWIGLTIITASFTRDVPHATRSFFMLLPLEFFSAYGFLMLLSKLKKYKRLTFFCILALLTFNIGYYFASYYIRFPHVYAKSWRYADKELSLFIKKNESKYDRIIIDPATGFMYTSLLFYSSYNPSTLQNTIKRTSDDSEGFNQVVSFGKYEFREIRWGIDNKTSRTLVITTYDKKPLEVSPIQVFYYPQRFVAFSVKQEIIEYPVEEIAYVAVESK